MAANPVSSHLGGLSEQLGSFALGSVGFVSGATLTLVKVVSGGSAVTTDFTLTATGPSTLSGAGGAGPSVVGSGTYALTETGPASYAVTWVCIGSSHTELGASVTIQPGETMVCTATNTFQVACPDIFTTSPAAPSPPSPADPPAACETPSTPSYTSGYNAYDEPSEGVGS